MKKYLFYSLLFLTTGTACAQPLNKQSTYLDAVNLSKIYVTNGSTAPDGSKPAWSPFFAVLQKYGITKQADVDNNPFFKGKMTIPAFQANTSSNGITTALAPTTSTAPVFSGNWQAVVINGLASFMADRFKEEAMHMALTDVFDKMTNDDKAIVSALFPKTYAEIVILDKSQNYYTADLLFLRQLVQADLAALPDNLVANMGTLLPQLQKYPQLEDAITLTYSAVKYSRENRTLPDMITMLAQLNYQSLDVSKALQVIDLVSTALRADGSSETWVQPTDISPLLLTTADNKVRFFYGLLYQQLTDAGMQKMAPDLVKYIQVVDDQAAATNISLLLPFISSLNEAYDYAKTTNFQFKTVDDAFKFIRPAAQAFQNFLQNTQVQQYLHINDGVSNTIGQLLDVTQSFLNKDYQQAVPLLVADLGQYFPAGSQQYTRSLAFISQLATIQTQDDMESLLDAYALPIGSSSIKRTALFNISLNSYVGATGGWETAYGSKAQQTKNNFGLSAPIGVAITYHGNLTLFVSVLDLGSIVNARLNNDTTYYSGLKLEQFFAPGAGLYYNFTKLPLTLGFNYTYIPNLRTITYQDGNATVTETNRSVTRFNFSALIDIPLLTLFNKTK
jgi:hypothetical protein